MNQEPLRLLLVHGPAGWPQPLLQQLHNQGLQLSCCRHLEEAQHHLLQAEPPQPFDLIVVDLAIGAQAWQRLVPWLQGHQLIQPILAVGSRLDEPSRVQLLESWADAVMSQPLSIPEFVARCRALWRRQQMRLAQQQRLHPNTCLQHQGIEMRVEEHRVWRQGREVEEREVAACIFRPSLEKARPPRLPETERL